MEGTTTKFENVSVINANEARAAMCQSKKHAERLYLTVFTCEALCQFTYRTKREKKWNPICGCFELAVHLKFKQRHPLNLHQYARV
jgi:hypothetical protein